MANISTDNVVVARFAGALYDLVLDPKTTNTVIVATANGLDKFMNAVFVRDFSQSSTASVSAIMVKNLGLTGSAKTQAEAFITGVLNTVPNDGRGAAIVQILSLFAQLTTDPTFGTFAVAWESKVTASVAYSQDASNTKTATLSTLPPPPAASVGQTYTLTSGVDVLTGTSGDDTFIADNTGAAKQLSVADQINGGSGTDTVKVFLAAADTTTGQPTFTSIETMYINGGAITAYSAATGTTGLIIDAPVALTNATYTLDGNQKITLQNSALTASTATAMTTTIAATATATATVLDLTLNKWTYSGTDTQVIDVSAAKVATLNITATGTASKIASFTNTGAAITTLNVAGDKGLTLTQDAATSSAITKINASTNTGGVTIDGSAGAKAAAFAFTGSTGNDKLTLAAGDLAILTAGTQLDGGAGTDTLVIKDTTPVYTKLNTVKNFEVLGLGVTGTTVDASLLTSMKSFSIGVAASTETINNLGAGSSVAITASTTAVTLGAAVGNVGTDITLGTTTTGGSTATLLTTTGLTVIGLTSNGTSVQTITTLANSDNTTLTVKGAADLTITNALAATTTGSKVDASAFTGKLSVIGSTKADVLIGGSGADTLQGAVVGTANQADTLTGGAGADKFVFTAATGAAFFATSAGTTAVAKITDFVAGVDKFDFITTGTAFTGATVANAQTIATAADLTAVYAGITAIAASTATNASAAVITVSAGAAAGTYLYVNDATAGVSNTADMLINITGVSGTVSATDFIFA